MSLFGIPSVIDNQLIANASSQANKMVSKHQAKNILESAENFVATSGMVHAAEKLAGNTTSCNRCAQILSQAMKL